MSLTNAQRGLYYAALADPHHRNGVVGERIALTGPLQLPLLHQAITDVSAGVPCWYEPPKTGTNETPQLSYPHDPVAVPIIEAPAAAVPQLSADHVSTPMPLTGALLRHLLIKVSATEHYWCLTAHHLICDGFSLHAIIQRCAARYQALIADQPPQDSTFGHPTAVHQAETKYRQSKASRTAAQYWRGQLADLSPTTHLANWPPAEPTTTLPPNGLDQISYCTTLTDQLTTALRTGAAQFQLTPALLILTAIGWQLGRLNQQEHVLVGHPIMRRNTPKRAAVCAPMVNVVPLRLSAHPRATLTDLVLHNATQVQQATKYGDYPAEQIAADHQLTAAALPWQVSVNVVPFSQQARFGPATAVLSTVRPGPLDDLAWTIHTGRDFRLTATAPAQANPTTEYLRAVTDHLLDTLGQFAPRNAKPRQRPALTTAPQQAPTQPTPSPSHNHRATSVQVLELLRRTAEQHPGRIALSDRNTQYTYAELLHTVTHRAADYPRTSTIVPVAAHPECATIVEFLAIWAAHCAIAPYHPHWPAHLIAQVHQLTGRAAPDIAWVIHTSGSQGVPKAVAVPHTAVTNLLSHHQNTGYVTTQPWHMLCTNGLHVDAAFDTWCGVFFGHRVHLAPREWAREPQPLLRYLAEHQVTFVDTTPATWLDLCAHESGEFATIQRAHTGGEPCPPQLWRTLQNYFGNRAVNLYGPTETTVDATTATMDSPTPHVGQPVTNTHCAVLDDLLNPVPAGAIGELSISGPQVAAGYLNNPRLTAQRFVAASHGQRQYLTGDAARFDQHGNVSLHGRRNTDVKIRGYRVDLADVQHRFNALPHVALAHVLVHDDHLTAYVQPDQGLLTPTETASSITQTHVQNWLRTLAKQLPNHAVPTRVHVVEHLPRSAAGAIAEDQLTPVHAAEPERTRSCPKEQATAAAFTAVLGDQTPTAGGLTEDFFALGGDSISAIALIAQLRDYGWSAEISSVFADRTITAIAATLKPHDQTTAATQPAADDFGLTLDSATADRVTALIKSRQERVSL